MIKVYIWRTLVANGFSSSSSAENEFIDWGHVAIEIPDSIHGSHCPQCYMSYWPPDKKSEKYSYYYQDDKESCGDAHRTIEIKNLNKSTMVETWEKELAKDFDDIDHNCCTVAAEILRAGYHESHFSSASTFFKRVRNRLNDPFDVMWRTAGNLFSDATVWTPKKIENFADYIKKIVEK